MSEPTFPDHEFLTVRELAELLRLKERKVYDLASSGELPCSRATGKLLFPADEIRAWIRKSKSGGQPAVSARMPIVVGSHDPLLDWAIRQSQCGLATYFDGSMDGLHRFARREGVAAGLHVRDGKSQTWNMEAVTDVAGDQNAVMIGFAKRQRGFVVRKDGPSPKRMADLAGLRLAPRQPGSGTWGLFNELAAGDGLDLTEVILTDVARTEDDAVENVLRDAADVTFGLEAVARTYGLDFVPVIEEEYSLVVDRRAWFEPPIRNLLAFCRSAAFRDRAGSYGGYDVSGFGTVLWNA